MTEDRNFLPHFIEEEIYIIKEDGELSVDSPKPDSQVVEEPLTDYVESSPLKYSGKNLKNVAILVPVIIDEEIAFLQKILGAVKFSLDDCALVGVDNNPNLKSLDELTPKAILSFGVAVDLSFTSGTLYEINILEGIKTIKADKLSSISADNTKKKLLWDALQKMFL